MKRILTAFMALLSALILCTCSTSENKQETDYIALMVDAAVSGDYVQGKGAEQLNREHLRTLGTEDGAISFDELLLLSKFIQLQSTLFRGNETLMLCTGEVALNRLSSREFPNNLEDVISQLADTEHEDFTRKPSKYCVQLALRLLRGERLLAPHVVHWSIEPQEDAYATFCDRQQNFVYFCESEHPRFYHLPNKKPT